MATIQTINVGTTPNDGTGDPLRDANIKINSNFQSVNDQANTSTNQIGNMKIWTEVKVSGGDQVFTIPNGGFSDSNYEYTYNAYDSGGYEVIGLVRVSKNATTITLNLPQACTVTINARKS
jgi:hypothetical protein